jgi:hypothetical protein
MNAVRWLNPLIALWAQKAVAGYGFLKSAEHRNLNTPLCNNTVAKSTWSQAIKVVIFSIREK